MCRKLRRGDILATSVVVLLLVVVGTGLLHDYITSRTYIPAKGPHYLTPNPTITPYLYTPTP
jgi:hypothetical protein